MQTSRQDSHRVALPVLHQHAQFVANKPQRHPFNPLHLIPLVEVVPYPGTPQSALQVAIELCKACGMTPVHIKEEIPGFAANRLQKVLLEEAYSLVNRGILTAEEVDTCVTNSLSIRWATVGPFMGNVFGRDQGGFKHLMEHVGASSQRGGGG
jgi:3-hydroxyacyl-CoA dehydrogenase